MSTDSVRITPYPAKPTRMIAAGAALGAVAGLLVLHPITMAVYWFEFHPDSAPVSTVWHFVLLRMRMGFSLAMLPMTGVFGVIGGSLGLAFGACLRMLAVRQRKLDQLERELSRGLGSLLAAGESETIEYKASARWDYREGRMNRALEATIVRTVAGFLNHRGGSLLIGVDDARHVVGLEHDYSTFRWKNRDGFELFLMDLIEGAMGADFCSLVHVVFHRIGEHDVCRVVVEASSRPAYVREPDATHFFVRTGNATRELDVDEALEHIGRQRVGAGRT